MRNQEPEFTCSFCEEKAVMICSEDGDFLCKLCGEDLESFPSPLVNSPRMGVCGYGG